VLCSLIVGQWRRLVVGSAAVVDGADNRTASITASERLRSRTRSSTVDHRLRIAAASGSPTAAERRARRRLDHRFGGRLHGRR
jgi:hypothetical protein